MVYLWKDIHSEVMRRLAKRQMETMSPENRVARAKKARAAQKWRPVKGKQGITSQQISRRGRENG